MTPMDWMLSGDTGTSSKCICAVMTGSKCQDGRPPSDPSDFGRCFRLLQHFPEWRPRMGEVAAKFPEWIALVRQWSELTDLYKLESQNKNGMAPQLYDRMKVLIDEGRIAAGWTKIGPGSWRGPKRTEMQFGKGITVSFGNE